MKVMHNLAIIIHIIGIKIIKNGIGLVILM